MAAVVHVDDLPVTPGLHLAQEDHGQHAVVDDTDHRTVGKLRDLVLLDEFPAHKRKRVICQVFVIPCSVLAVDLALLL